MQSCKYLKAKTLLHKNSLTKQAKFSNYEARHRGFNSHLIYIILSLKLLKNSQAKN